MNTQAHDPKTPSTQNLADSLYDLGLEWAALGISFGTEAVSRSARSLELVAKTLDTVARTLNERRRHVEPTEPETIDVVDAVDISAATNAAPEMTAPPDRAAAG